MSGYASRFRSLAFSGALSSLSLYGPSINYCFASHFGYQFNAITTAAIMYSFALLALLIGSIQMKLRANWTVGVILTLLSLLGISALWIINYAIDYQSIREFSQYDLRRPAFAFHGAVIFGLLGVIASRDPASFLRGFLKLSIINSIILALLYLPLYDASAELTRIGGDAGLIIGILLSQGVASVLAMIWLGWTNFFAGLLSLPWLILAIIMSGTRSALLATALILALFFLLRPSRSRVRKAVGIFVFLVTLSIGIIFSGSLIPDATLARITNFNLEGSESRLALLHSAWTIFSEHPFGRTAGYVGMFAAEIEYSHNAAVQVILETGVFSLIFLLILMAGCARAVFECHGSHGSVLRAFIYYAITVYLVSFSAGDAYNPQFWLVTTLLAASGLDFSRQRRVEHRLLHHPVIEQRILIENK